MLLLDGLSLKSPITIILTSFDSSRNLAIISVTLFDDAKRFGSDSFSPSRLDDQWLTIT